MSYGGELLKGVCCGVALAVIGAGGLRACLDAPGPAEALAYGLLAAAGLGFGVTYVAVGTLQWLRGRRAAAAARACPECGHPAREHDQDGCWSWDDIYCKCRRDFGYRPPGPGKGGG